MSDKIRVALMANGFWGASLINELAAGDSSQFVEIVGVCVDRASWDDSRSYSALSKLQKKDRAVALHHRAWLDFFELGESFYEHSRSLVPSLANHYGIEILNPRSLAENGRDQISDAFANTLLTRWQPNLILSAFFGQKIPTDAVRYVSNGKASSDGNGGSYRCHQALSSAIQMRSSEQRLGCFNFHPSTHEWPSKFAGGQPFHSLSTSPGVSQIVMTMHEVQWEYDSGRMHKQSSPIPIFPGIHPFEVYMSCAQGIVELVRHEIRENSLLRAASRVKP